MDCGITDCKLTSGRDPVLPKFPEGIIDLVNLRSQANSVVLYYLQCQNSAMVIYENSDIMASGISI